MFNKIFSGDYDYVATLTDEYPKVDISLKRFIGGEFRLCPETAQKMFKAYIRGEA